MACCWDLPLRGSLAPEITPTGKAIDSEYKAAQKHFADVLESFIDQWPSMNQFLKDDEANCHGLRWIHSSQSNITSDNITRKRSCCVAKQAG